MVQVCAELMETSPARLTEEEMVLSAIEKAVSAFGDDEDLTKLLKSTGESVFQLFCVDIVDLIRSGTAVRNFYQLSIKALPFLWEALSKKLGLPTLKA